MSRHSRRGVIASVPSSSTPQPVLGITQAAGISNGISTAASWGVSSQFSSEQQYGDGTYKDTQTYPTLASQSWSGGRYNVMISVAGSSSADLNAAITVNLNDALSAGLTHIYLRPMWESNANFQPWSPYYYSGSPFTVASFKAALQSAYTLAHSIMPNVNVIFGLNGNPTRNWSTGDAFDVDPGSAYYDSVGFDVYDGNGNGSPAQVTSVMAAWAQSKGKPWGLPEYGLWQNGDDPTWMTAMANAILNPTYPAQYHFYFNLSPNTMLPNTLVVYTARFG